MADRQQQTSESTPLLFAEAVPFQGHRLGRMADRQQLNPVLEVLLDGSRNVIRFVRCVRIIVLGAVCLLGLYFLIFPPDDSEAPADSSNIGPVISNDAGTKKESKNGTAPLNLVLFHDFQCPFSKQAFDEIVSQLLVPIQRCPMDWTLVDFPVGLRPDMPDGFHPHSVQAAVGARCSYIAQQQDLPMPPGPYVQYWEMAQSIYQHQEELNAASDDEAVSVLLNDCFSDLVTSKTNSTTSAIDIAESVESSFAHCLQSERALAEVRIEFARAWRNGNFVRGVPILIFWQPGQPKQMAVGVSDDFHVAMHSMRNNCLE